MSIHHKSVKAYLFPLSLIFSIVLGGVVGSLGGDIALRLKPLGDVFLNLIFETIVPLVFFSVSSAIARTGEVKKLSKIFFYMTLVFLLTGTVAAIIALVIVKIFPLANVVPIQHILPEKMAKLSFSSALVEVFTVPDFAQLLSHQHMLALIVFSILVGIATSLAREKGTVFMTFLQAGEAIFMRVFSLIMYYAPIGFFAYFAVLVHDIGPKLMENYMRIAVIYYGLSLGYFLIAFTGYAYLAGRLKGIALFWKNVFLPMVTAIATCSSAASIPANLKATKAMHVSKEIYETVVPLGSIIHKDGSVIGGMVKIAFLFGVFHYDFSGAYVLFTAVGVSLLVGTVMGAIPSGGMLGELLILSIYGFPPSALLVIAAISIIIDPMATLLNVTGNSVSSMLIARLVEGRTWLNRDASIDK